MEKWADITGHEGKYQISTFGRVKSLARDYKYGSHDDIILKPTDRRGYEGVTLFDADGRNRRAVHRLVAEAFLPNPDGKPCVNHIDENRKNNHVTNLEWCTHLENSRHGNCRKKISSGVSKPVVQLSKDDELIREWGSMTEIYQNMGIEISQISICCSGKGKTAGGFKWKTREAFLNEQKH